MIVVRRLKASLLNLLTLLCHSGYKLMFVVHTRSSKNANVYIIYTCYTIYTVRLYHLASVLHVHVFVLTWVDCVL